MKWLLPAVFLLTQTICHSQIREGFRLVNPLSSSAQALNKVKNGQPGIFPLAILLDSLEVQSTADSVWLKPQSKWQVSPVADISAGLSTYPTFGNSSFGSAGVEAMVKMKRRFFAQAEYQGAWQYFPDHLQQFTHNREVLPGMGEAFGSNVPQFAHYWTASAGLKMGNHFQLDVGRDKHFWGDGYRSMILSHNAAPYPYMRLTTKIWRVKYVNLWTVLKDISTDQTRTRYMSAHALSWNVTPAFNLSLFESVVWQEKDSLSQRGFEPSYLNPFIFYRPVEFAQGSGDNVLLGLSARVKVYDYATLYGQIYFDEFLMAELRRGEGWWANKFAVQLGAKAMDIASTGTNLLTEINLARPFTYTHGSVVQAYGHLNQALAHPLGTNFFEWLVSGSYTHKNLRYTFHHVLAYFGEDPDGLNYGTDIFKSYRNPALLYGNKIGQGTKNTLSTLRLGVEKDVNWGVPVVLNAELGLRKLTNQYDNPLDTWLMIGIRTPMVRPYRDF